MKLLKNLLFLLFCGSCAFRKREYFKGVFLSSSFIISFYVLFLGMHSDGIRILFFIFLSFFLFFFAVVYNFLDVCSDKTIPLRHSSICVEDNGFYEKAIQFYLQDHIDEAIKILSAMKKKNKNDADLYFQIGKLYYKKRLYKKSQNMFKKYLSFDSAKKWNRQTKSYLNKLRRVL